MAKCTFGCAVSFHLCMKCPLNAMLYQLMVMMHACWKKSSFIWKLYNSQQKDRALADSIEAYESFGNGPVARLVLVASLTGAPKLEFAD